jgi:hypothetical protein
MDSNARYMEVQGRPPERKGDATCRVEDRAREERVMKLRLKEEGSSAKCVAANEGGSCTPNLSRRLCATRRVVLFVFALRVSR